MAGYLISLNDFNSLVNCIKTGTYSTTFKEVKKYWNKAQEGTFADYLSMKENDYVFFFIKRKIYGCGRLKNNGGDCKYLNFIDADYPDKNAENNFKKTHLLPHSTINNRCFCTFEPDPAFFKKGIDMDEVLQDKSCPYYAVRSFWKLSFIKLDDEESKALYSLIIKHNEDSLGGNAETFEYSVATQAALSSRDLTEYQLTSSAIIQSSRKDHLVKHEMALEAALCEKLTNEEVLPFGKWNYISHQVCASPFKPVDYMDKMDIFGYRYVSKEFAKDIDIKSRYLIAELKKDAATPEVVEQVLKYVDYVSDVYANGDYSMIEAFIVAANFGDRIKQMVREHAIRNYIKGFRPTQFLVWNKLKLVRYHVDDSGVSFYEEPVFETIE